MKTSSSKEVIDAGVYFLIIKAFSCLGPLDFEDVFTIFETQCGCRVLCIFLSQTDGRSSALLRGVPFSYLKGGQAKPTARHISIGTYLGVFAKQVAFSF